MVNAERLRKVADAIETEHNQWGFDMDSWLEVTDPDYYDVQIKESDLTIRNIEPKPNCGTTMCIAGWTCALFVDEAEALLSIEDKNYDDIAFRAGEILGLTRDDALTLFLNSLELTATTAPMVLRYLADGLPLYEAKTRVHEGN